jgi:hypothetical protein
LKTFAATNPKLVKAKAPPPIPSIKSLNNPNTTLKLSAKALVIFSSNKTS